MTIFGVDLHPRFQSGISIDRIHAEGFGFIICKLSEGTGSSGYTGSRAWIARGRELGLHVGGYHYLRAGNIAAQVDVFCGALDAAGSPAAMLDVEAGGGGISGVREFVVRCAERGHPIRMLYLPRWYWQQIGRPSLAGLPPLWSSRYASTTGGAASLLYGRTPGSYWGGYGGGGVAVLQFSSTAWVAGRSVDANAYEGGHDQLAALFGAAPAPAAAPERRPTVNEELSMNGHSPAIPRDEHGNPTTPKHDWPTTYVNFGFLPGQTIHLHTGGVGGWIHWIRWWVKDPNWTANIPKHFWRDHPVGPDGSERFVGYAWEVPAEPGADEVEIVLSAPDGYHLFAS